MSLDKLENKVQIHHWHVSRFHTVKKTAKIGAVHLEIFDEIGQNTTWTRNAISIQMFSTETAAPIFSKILHIIGAI